MGASYCTKESRTLGFHQTALLGCKIYQTFFPFRVIMVVGAGRGPLVRASLTAGEESGRKVRVYAVEKNPNAVVT